MLQLKTILKVLFHADVVVPRFRESVGTLNLIRPSVPLSVCLSVRLSQKL